MITLLQGVPGSGKTLWAMEQIYDRLRAGQEVYTNIDLVPAWPAMISGRGIRKHFVPEEQLLEEAHKLQGLYTHIQAVSDLPTSMAPEGSRLCIIDEAQLIFNTRDREREARGGEWLKWFSQHRKFGFDVVLAAQDHQMLDKQLRSLGEQLVTCFNLKRLSIPLLFFGSIPIGPFIQLFTGPMILRRCTMLGLKGMKLWSEMSPIPKYVANLYNTKQVYGLGAKRIDRGFEVDDLAQVATPVDPARDTSPYTWREPLQRLHGALDTAWTAAELGDEWAEWHELWERQLRASLVDQANGSPRRRRPTQRLRKVQPAAQAA